MLARLLFKYILVRAVAFTYTHRCKISHVTSCRFALPVTLPIQALPIAIADCHFDSGFDHVTSHVATKLLLACAPLAMWEFPTSRLPVSSATAVIFQVNTSAYIGFIKIRCQHQYYSLQLLAKIVMRSLMLQFRREMGLKSLTVSGLLIFGTKWRRNYWFFPSLGCHCKI